MGAYNAEIVAGSLLVSESRTMAKLLLDGVDRKQIDYLVANDNILQKRNVASAKRQASLILNRLKYAEKDLLRMVIASDHELSAQALLVCVIKQNKLLGDFLQQVAAKKINSYEEPIYNSDWESFINDCASSNENVSNWSKNTKDKLRQVIFRIMKEVGYIENSRKPLIHNISLRPEIKSYLQDNNEDYVLNSIELKG